MGISAGLAVVGVSSGLVVIGAVSLGTPCVVKESGAVGGFDV
jgi:hypothetical protein